MKKLLYTLILFSLASLIWVSCSKKEPWTDGADTPKVEVNGKVLNGDDNSPIKGIKLSIARVISSDGDFIAIDTVSSGGDGSFSLSASYPNKFRVVVQDTLRYTADTVFIDLTNNGNAPSNLIIRTIPRFGVSSINVNVVDEDTEAALANIKVALMVRDSNNDDYSVVDTLNTDASGKVSFKDIAFPVNYKVEIADHPLAYVAASEEGALTTKDPLQLSLSSKALFATGDITLKAMYYYTNKIAANTPVIVSYKSVFDDEFTDYELTTDVDAKLVLTNVDYPGILKVLPKSDMVHPFKPIELEVSLLNAGSTILVNLFDAQPRFENMTPSANISENVLVAFYEGVSIQEMELDSKGNIFAVTTDNTFVRVAQDGSGHKVLATGFSTPWGIAIQNDSTFYVVENNASSGNKIKKVTLDLETDVATVSILTGQNSSGSKDGSLAEATFSRPGDAVYDSSRNCLWVSEWSGRKIRRVDLTPGSEGVSTAATGVGFGLAIGITSDFKYLYMSSHTNSSGIYKYDIEENKAELLKGLSYSVRHLAVAPNNDVYFNINRYQAKVYKLTSEGPASGGPNSTFTTIAGNSSWGAIPAIGYQGSADITISQNNVDGSPNGLVYDAFRGRLYFANAADNRLYYVILGANLD